ncbi:ExbD/TolR family protein [Celeribacter ethanolicus]|uniref:ExbD/TolR family protein n=1 Tax=Celeribacter ethanolicus TaxID=1758178 RepID=UPI00082F80E8|nr:biopolymer transporter ExbD [Celeribacter ethanolicus]
MKFASPPKSRVSVGLLPMINVVFLLLIFFLIAGEMQQPEPIDVNLPDVAHAQEAEGDLSLYLGPDGRLAFRDLDVAFEDRQSLMAALSESLTDCGGDTCAPVLLLHADRDAPARLIAELLPELGAAGFEQVNLVAMGRGTAERGQP